MKHRSLYRVCLVALALAFIACGGAARKGAPNASPGARPASQVYRELNVRRILIPKGRHGRWKTRRMQPRYITIHSTQNYTGDAWDHSRALNRGALRAQMRAGGNRTGYLTWHYTVQDDVCIQHLPTNEQGEHADFDGPGNNYSIAIEMCEHRGNDRDATVERTAKLAAYLMNRYHIPLQNVVPHYHWPRRGYDPPNKNCPHFLLDNGRPGRKWSAFLRKVEGYHRQIRQRDGQAGRTPGRR